MATFNKPILTTQGLAMLKSEISGSAQLAFTKVIFTSDDYSQLSDTDVANLTDIKGKDITAKAQTFVGADSTTKIRATADNRSSNQAFYIKGYALYAKQNSNEVLFAVAVSDTSDYVPAFNNKQLSQVSYTFQFAISETNNITLSDTHDIPVTQADIQGLTTYVNSKSSDLTSLINDATNKSAQDTLSKANQYTDSQVSDKATQSYVNSAISTANKYTDDNVKQINENISNKADQSSLDELSGKALKKQSYVFANRENVLDIKDMEDGYYFVNNASNCPFLYGVIEKMSFGDDTVLFMIETSTGRFASNGHAYGSSGWSGWKIMGG